MIAFDPDLIGATELDRDLVAYDLRDAIENYEAEHARAILTGYPIRPGARRLP